MARLCDKFIIFVFCLTFILPSTYQSLRNGLPPDILHVYSDNNDNFNKPKIIDLTSDNNNNNLETTNINRMKRNVLSPKTTSNGRTADFDNINQLITTQVSLFLFH